MIPLVELAPGYSVPRVILGGWQLSAGHSAQGIEREALFRLWDDSLDRGLNTFDCADIYTGVEALIGDYVRRRRAAGVALPQVHTKFVPDLAALPRLGRRYLERVIDRSLQRLGMERLDLVQFHWWDYAVPRYLDTLGWLGDLVRDGKIRLVGLTNFDTVRLRECLTTGVPLASVQLQYSVLDQRPARGLDRVADANRVALLCYGTLAGGFLSDRWLGAPEPAEAENRSLVKYRLVIDDIGGWPAFQRALAALAAIGRRRGVPTAAVAIRWVLEQRGVAAAIVGCRKAEHFRMIESVFGWRFETTDAKELADAAGSRPGPQGDVYEAERIPGGRHAAIMRYDLNAQAMDGVSTTERGDRRRSG
ncbi:MAG: aldo/keto reductase [Gemmatimonadales bacterium]